MNASRTARNGMILLVLFLAFLIPCSRACAVTVTCHPDMTDLYDAPGGNIVARLFYGIPVTIEETGADWVRITAGDENAVLEGWTASADLDELDADQAGRLPGGQVAMGCAGVTAVPVLAGPKEGAAVLETWRSADERWLTACGITADNRWLLAALCEEEKTLLWGFVPADRFCCYSAGFVLASKAGRTVNLREAPSKKAASIGSYYSGALLEFLFDFSGTDGWQRVSLGGVPGYMMCEFIETDGADGIPWRSPLLPLKEETAPLYAAASGEGTVAELPLLTRKEVFCVLGRAGDRWHVKVYTGETGVWIFGFVDAKALKGKSPVCPSVDAKLTKNTALLGSWDGSEPQCKKGKKVRISSFYKQDPSDGDSVPLDYYEDGVRWAWITVYMRGGYGFDEPFSGYVPVSALSFDKGLKLPAGMGTK